MEAAGAPKDPWGEGAVLWSELIEPLHRPLYVSALDTAGVNVGTKYLDAACGAGLALGLADELDADVHGFDASPAMLEVARERVPGADIRQGDLMRAPFEDDSFDVVTCFNGIQFADDKRAAIGELRRVARPDSHVVVAGWGDYEDCEMRFVFEALLSVMPSSGDTGPLEEWGPFALSPPGRLQELAEAAGLRVELEPHVACPFTFPDLDTALRAILSTGPAAAARAQAGEERVRDAVAGALEGFRRDDGSYRLNNMFRYVLAHA